MTDYVVLHTLVITRFSKSGRVLRQVTSHTDHFFFSVALWPIPLSETSYCLSKISLSGSYS